jgi:Ser/Thr protein kinase RdoA (MazF antagonist)
LPVVEVPNLPFQWAEGEPARVNGDVVAYLEALLGQHIDVVRLDRSTDVSGRFYAASGGRQWYVRVVEPRLAATTELVEALLAPLGDREHLVIRSIDGKVHRIPGGYALTVSPWVASRHVDMHVDPVQLAEAVARLHRLLSKAPDAAKVQQRAGQRREALQDRLRGVSSGPAARILDHTGQSLGLMDDLAGQVLHGDLNPGNILITDVGSICFCDFEDAIHTYGSPVIDLAIIVERLLLSRGEAVIATFLRTYQKLAAPVARTGWLVDSLKLINLRAAALLLLAGDQGHHVPPEEWQKFVDHAARIDSVASRLMSAERLSGLTG